MLLMIHVFRLPPTTKMKCKEGTRRGPSFSWRDGFLPSPSNARVCAHLFIVKSEKNENDQILSKARKTVDIAKHFGYNITKSTKS